MQPCHFKPFARRHILFSSQRLVLRDELFGLSPNIVKHYMKQSTLMLLRLLYRQSKMDFKKRYLGTMFGSFWAIAAQLVTIALIYFVFTFGLKSGAMGKISFIDWLIPGMLAWFFISEAIANSCSAILESSYLVTKIVFPVQILPLSKVIACFPVHCILMLIFMCSLLFQGTASIALWWQIGYYCICAIIFCCTLSIISSTCMIFIRDTANIVSVMLQVIFWATPIFWDAQMIAKSRFSFLLLSPFNYILQGYRDSLFSGVYFWQRPYETMLFWSIVTVLYFFGFYLFKTMRPHFADVL